jgi:uncharacterized protein YrrD
MIPDPLMRGSDLIGRPIVNARDGENVAVVRDVVFNPAGGMLVGFTLTATPGHLGTVLPIGGISSIGTDAVMVLGTEGFSAPESINGQGVAAARLADNDVIDDLVVTESGRALGKVCDVIVRGGASPQVVAFQIEGGECGAGLVPIGDHRGVSGSALIVPDEFETRIHHDLTGLATELGAPTSRQNGNES